MFDAPSMSSSAENPGKREDHLRMRQKWWHSIKAECPISLVPINELLQPPFTLDVVGSSTVHCFDARFLASFLISSTDFINPMNRQPLKRHDCVALDAHLRKYHPESKLLSVTDSFDLFQMKCSGGDQIQREATAVLQHLFRYSSKRRTHEVSPTAAVNFDREVAPPELGSEAFPALLGNWNGDNTSPSQSNGVRHSARLRTARRRRQNSDNLSESVVNDERSDSIGTARPILTESVEPRVLSETAREFDKSEIGSYCALKVCEPQFLQPLIESESFVSTDFEKRDATIVEEIEVLKAIYGDGAVVCSKSHSNDGQSCWDIQVASPPWNLHVVIPVGCPYPFACPLLRPSHDEQRLTPQTLKSINETFGSIAKSRSSETFIFNLVESLKDVEI